VVLVSKGRMKAIQALTNQIGHVGHGVGGSITGGSITSGGATTTALPGSVVSGSAVLGDVSPVEGAE